MIGCEIQEFLLKVQLFNYSRFLCLVCYLEIVFLLTLGSPTSLKVYSSRPLFECFRIFRFLSLLIGRIYVLFTTKELLILFMYLLFNQLVHVFPQLYRRRFLVFNTIIIHCFFLIHQEPLCCLHIVSGFSSEIISLVKISNTHASIFCFLFDFSHNQRCVMVGQKFNLFCRCFV